MSLTATRSVLLPTEQPTRLNVTALLSGNLLN